MKKKEIYINEAIRQVPRLLTILDRNEHSPTFGCFYRIFWHDKVTDIPSAHPQIGVLVLALLYKHRFSNNPYYQNEKIKKWCIGGMNFWANIQNKNGSFNEHYPNEQSFGATAWTLSAILDSYILLENEIPEDDKSSILDAALRASRWLIKNDDPGPLTNHIAISAMALYNMFKITKNKKFLRGASKKIRDTLNYQSSEGWFLEYDGLDLGYLTTTISFLARYYQQTKNSKVFNALKKAIQFSSYFVYPDCFYGGFVGSRHTVHFHPSGFEIMSKKIPIAATITKKILEGIKTGRTLTPSAMDDKYFSNSLIELLQSYLYFNPKSPKKQKLPCESQTFKKYFKQSKFLLVKEPLYYMVVSMNKGGVMYVFDTKKSKLILSDAGISGVMKNGKTVSSQWMDDKYLVEVNDSNLSVSGRFHEISSETLSPTKMIFSRVGFLTLARSSKFSLFIKKNLIKRLITSSKKLPLKFERELNFDPERIQIKDTIKGRGLISIGIKDLFVSRYVPASRYFQEHELTTNSFDQSSLIKKLRDTGKITILRTVTFPRGKIDITSE